MSIDGSQTRTILPSVSMVVASYTISGAGPNGTSFTQTTAGTALTITSMAVGSWTITVQALNSSGNIIGSGTGTTTIVQDASASVAITVTPVTGTGALNLAVTWPPTVVVAPSIVATLTPFGGSSTTVPFTISGAVGSYSSSSIPNGYSTFNLSLYDNGVRVGGAIEVIRVIAGQPTTGAFTFSNVNEATGTAQVTVTTNLMPPLSVSISGATSTLTLGTGGSMNLTAAVSNYSGSLEYAWYVNGILAAQGANYTFGLPRGIGNYRIDVTAYTTEGTQAGSASTNVQVVTAPGYTGPAGIVTTLASTGFSSPASASISVDGNLYVADSGNNVIKKIVVSSGTTTVFAGSGTWGSANGTGAAASFANPSGIASDGTNLYVADKGNNVIRKIVLSSGVVTTLAGSGAGGSTDGTGTAAQFNGPVGIATDGTNVYVSDAYSSKIRKVVIATGVVTTLAGAGYGSNNGTGTSAGFSGPVGLATDGTNLYVADAGNNMIRKIVISTAVVTTLAGSTTAGSSNGTGTAATFKAPAGVATDGTNLYVADTSNNLIRKIVIATGVVTTLAGSGTAGSVNGTGTTATFKTPGGLTTDGLYVYVADTGNSIIRKIE